MSDHQRRSPARPRPTGAGPERASSFSLDVERQTVGDAFRGYVNRLRSGEPGALPSVLGLVVLGVIFSQVSDRFLSAEQHRQPARAGRLHRDHRAWAWCSSCCSARSTCRPARPAACAPAFAAQARVLRRPAHGIPGAGVPLLGPASSSMLAAARPRVLAQGDQRADRRRSSASSSSLTGLRQARRCSRWSVADRARRRGGHLHRLAGRLGRHPELHRHAGAVPGLAGRAALRPELAADRRQQLQRSGTGWRTTTCRRCGAGSSRSWWSAATSPTR